MEINDTIQTLSIIRRALDTWVPRRGARPDVLIADLNDLYVGSVKNRGMDELFAYDDVGGASITLSVGIDAEFDLQTVTQNMRTKLHVHQPGRTDEIGKAGIVWSCGRYDFVVDEGSKLLRISHKYSHKRIDTKSVASIVRRMIDHALSYLDEVRASARGNADTPVPE
jgi:hypothetical protein